MRPDKKGKRKSHPGQSSGGGGRGAPSQTKTSSARDAPRPAAVKPQSAPLGTSTAAPQGPRVLPPAEPPAAAAAQTAAKYRAREIRSNWARYEEPPDAEEQLQPGEDYRRGDTFEELLAAAGCGGGDFRLRSERGWLRGGVAELPALLTLDVDRLAGLLQRVPLHTRLDIDEKHFTPEELDSFCLEAAAGDGCDVTQRQQVCQRTLDLLTAADTDTPAQAAEDAARTSAEEDRVAVKEKLADETAVAAVVGVEPATAGNGSQNGPVISDATDSASGDTMSSEGPPPAVAAQPVGVSNDVTATTCDVTGPAALLDEDWLDSVLSDED